MKAKTAYRLKMGFRCAVVTAVTLLCCLTTLTDAVGQGNRAVTFDELLNGIKNSEKKLLNLRVDGKCLFLDWDAGKQDWQYAGESDVTAWYIGVPGSKVRVDIHKMIMRWEDGPAPFAHLGKTEAYNGRVGQHLFLETGAADKPFKTLEGQITADRPVIDYAGSGWECSLYGCQDQLKMRLSEYLESANKQESVHCSVNPVRFNDTDCIELVVQMTPPRGESQKETWYFDPSRGYAILFYEHTGLREQETVEKLVEPAPGIYYPVKITSLTKDKSGQPASKWVYEASAVVANDPNFSDDIFTIKWPEGTRVQDKISGTTFTVGASASETEKRIRHQVKEVKTALTNPPSPDSIGASPQPVAARTPSTPKEGVGSASASRGAPVYFWGIGIIVVAGVLTLLLWFTLKGPRK